MIDDGDTVVAAVSGGVDSMVMLHFLLAVRADLSLNIVVAHLDHNLRAGESRRDFAFVRDSAVSCGAVFEGKRLKKGALRSRTGESVQAAAREERYRFLEQTAVKHGAVKIALGHNLDDQAETVLMRLVKGSALAGLAGIPPVRPPFIRPLIEVPRLEIESFAKKARIGYVTDSSNKKAVYLRNSVRLKLIPYLRKNYNPGLIDALGRTARILRHDEDFIDAAADAFLSASLKREAMGTVELERKTLAQAHPALSSRVFLKAVASVKRGSSLGSAHVDTFLSIVCGTRPNAQAALPGGVVLRREYDSIIITARKGTKSRYEWFDKALRAPGTTFLDGCGAYFMATILGATEFRGDELKKKADVAYFDLDRIPGRLRVRPWSPGDRIIPFGMKGTKKLKDIFIEKKIPPARRARVPVLYSRDSGLLWAAGVRRSDLGRVEGSTKRILKVEYVRRACDE